MNSAVRRFILFFFSLATLAACDNPTDIGIDLQEDNKIGTDYTDTLTVNTGTVLMNDSILSFRRTPALLGFVNDPVLGKVRATHYTEIGLGGTEVKFGENPVADSLVLTLDYNFMYGASTNPITIKVYELEEGFQEKASYFTDSELAYKNTLLGSKTVVPAVNNNAKAKADSATLIRIKLDPALTQKILAESGEETLKNQQNFNNFIKGLALVVEGNTDGKIIGVNVAPNTVIKSNQTAMTLYYKNGTESKTHSFVFYGTGVRNFSNITADRTGSVLEALQEKGQYISSAETAGLSFVQAGTQLFTKLTIPYLEKLKEEHGEFVVNRAELVVPVVQTSTFAPPERLVMYETNNTNRILKDANGVPKAVQLGYMAAYDTYVYPTALYYNSDKSYYTADITSHVQGIFLGKKENSSLLLAAANLASSSNGTSQITQEIRPVRAILSNTEANGVKLRIYFSKLN